MNKNEKAIITEINQKIKGTKPLTLLELLEKIKKERRKRFSSRFLCWNALKVIGEHHNFCHDRLDNLKSLHLNFWRREYKEFKKWIIGIGNVYYEKEYKTLNYQWTTSWPPPTDTNVRDYELNKKIKELKGKQKNG